MSTDSKAQWLKLTVVQLKGALTMRGLDVEGKKAELVERLAEYEAKKEKEKEEADKKAAEAKEKGETEGEEKANGEHEKMETQESEEKEKEKEKEEEQDTYCLKRGKFIGTYRSSAALLTVLITPFNNDFFSTESFNEHIRRARIFTIKKMWNGTSAAELRFTTLGESEEAFLALKNELASMDVDVYHPGMRAHFNQPLMRNQEFATIFEGVAEDGGSLERFVIVDKLPEGTTDSKLAELIPEAIEFLDLGLYEESKGCIAIVFNNKDACTKWMEKHKESPLTIDETPVRCTYYNKKDRIGNMVRNKQNREKKQRGEEEEKKEEKEIKFSDEERLAKVKEWNDILNSRNVLQDRDDITGYEKLVEEKNMTEGMTTLARELLVDAKRRIAANEKVPEPEEQMTAPVKAVVKGEAPGPGNRRGKPNTDGQKTPNRPDNRDRRGNQQRGGQSADRGRGQQGRGGGQGGNMRGNQQRNRQNQRGPGRGGSSGMNRSPAQQNMRKRPSVGPIRQLSRGGSYYDDAPSRKKQRQQSPYRGGMSSNMGGYGMPQEQQLHGLTSMLSDKMRELERMQQQTLAVQNQLSQNMRMAESRGLNDSYGSSTSMLANTGSQGYSSMGSYNTPSSQSSYSGGNMSTSGYGDNSYGNYGSSSMGTSSYSNMAGGYGSSSNYMASGNTSVQSGSSWGGGYGGDSSTGGQALYGGNQGSYGGNRNTGGRPSFGGNQRRNSGGGGGGNKRKNQNRRR